MVDALALYRSTVRARLVDERLEQLSRAGRIAYVPSARGSELSLVASVSVLLQDEMAFPGASESMVMLARGMPIATYLGRVLGWDEHGEPVPPLIGGARALRVGSCSSLLSNHLTHAVGYAWASRLREPGKAVMSWASSAAIASGEAHSALNFAGVARAPWVLVVRAGDDGTHAAEAAIAYGIREARSSVGDLDQLLEALGEAVEHARTGGGATLLEVHEDERALERFAASLIESGRWDITRDLAMRRDLDLEIETALEDLLVHGSEPELAQRARRGAAPAQGEVQ